jgi:hypothetical protein
MKMLNLTQKQFNEMLKRNPALRIDEKHSQPARAGPKQSKYRNQKTEVDGITFDSRREANRYCELKVLLELGEITDLELQPRFVLREGFWKNGKRYRKIVYRADFKYRAVATGEIVVEDVKGVKTSVYRLKKKLFEDKYPDLSLKEVS